MPSGFESIQRRELSLRRLHETWEPCRWPGASLYCVVARSAYCGIDKVTTVAPSLGSLLPGRGTAMSDEEWAQLESYAGADECSAPRRLAQARTGAVDTAIWSRVLRYCVPCLRCGYHATLYQHLAIDRCMLHHQPLVSACYRCGQSVVPVMSTARVLSFKCPACSRMLVNEPGVRLGHLAWEADPLLAAMRARIEPVASMHYEQCRTPGPSFGPPAVAARLAARFSIWVDGAPFRRFRQEALPLSMSQEPARGEGLAVPGKWESDQHAQWAALRWLVLSVAPAVQAEVADLAARMIGQQNGARQHGERSVLAVAIVKTAHLLGLSRDLASQTPAPPPPQSRGDPGPHAALSFSRSQWQQLNQRLLVLEVWALCASCLLQAGKLRRLVDYNWSEAPPPIAWAPAWRIDRVDGVAVARIRARVNEKGMQRLLHRYGRARLSSEAPTSVNQPSRTRPPARAAEEE